MRSKGVASARQRVTNLTEHTTINIETFKQIARKYIDFDELTPEIINNLISHITVSHVKVINGTKFREIKIIYKFIG